MGLFAIFDCNTAVLHASTIVQATTVYASSAQESQVTTVPTKCRLRALILASNGQCMESMQQPARLASVRFASAALQLGPVHGAGRYRVASFRIPNPIKPGRIPILYIQTV